MARRTSPGLPKGKLNVFGPRLQAMRMERGWSQLQFMLRLRKSGWHINASTLANIETGQRSLTDNEIVFLLKVLGFKLSDLEVLAK